MSASSHSLSFPALLAQLRSLLPQDKHAALDAVSVSFNSAPSDKASVRAARVVERSNPPHAISFPWPRLHPPPPCSLHLQVQRRLCEIAGKEVVQAAVLHLLGQQESKPPALAAVPEEGFAPPLASHPAAELAMTVGVASNGAEAAAAAAKAQQAHTPSAPTLPPPHPPSAPTLPPVSPCLSASPFLPSYLPLPAYLPPCLSPHRPQQRRSRRTRPPRPDRDPDPDPEPDAGPGPDPDPGRADPAP